MRKLKIVVVLEGGNIQKIYSESEQVEILKVDYDVLGFPLSELRRVYQMNNGSKKTYKLATVEVWENVDKNLLEIKKHFRLVKRKK